MAKSKTRKSGKPFALSLATGKLDVAKNGMGYVSVTGQPVDIIIKREHLKSAMNGDTVEVDIINSPRSGKRQEGIISKIIKRGQTELIGTIQMNANFAFVIPDNESFTKDIFINEKNSRGLKEGDRVIVRITDWNERMKNPTGEIIEKLDASKSGDIAMKELLLQAGFSLEFPDEVMEEVKQIPTLIDDEEIAKRKDIRNILTITIDPHDAKDFDDAISFRILKNKNYEIGVHIADVAHYVKPTTALDAEAYKRATSVYLPDRVLPMLPEKISNELCSLRPNEDKLTFSVMFQLNEKAEVQNYWLGKTVIHSNRRFTYEEVQEIIEGKEGDHQTEILTLHRLSQQIRKEKFDNGAINFSSEEVRFKLDENGAPIDIIIKESKASHQLIEELMLLANKTVSEYASKIKKNKASVPFPYRVHDTPDIDKLKSFAAFAGKFGHKFDFSSPATIASSFNKMIANASQHPEQEILTTLAIRTMAKAIYTTENIGHYGLGFEYYSHFTSPIRRYPDVLSHRILLGCLENDIQFIKNLEEQCAHCSERERKAMEAEREANKYKQVEFMQQHVGEEFDAVISGVAAFGFWAQTIPHKCEGLISLNNLLDLDEFKFVEEEYALVGKRSRLKFQMGNTVKIKVAAANLSKRQLDFELIIKRI
jgi:ribonuclease R